MSIDSQSFVEVSKHLCIVYFLSNLLSDMGAHASVIFWDFPCNKTDWEPHFIIFKVSNLSMSKAGLGNVRPVGHMRPAKHFNVAREL